MKYEDYLVSDCVFLTKSDWTDEEKAEVVATFPECKGTEEKIAALEKAIADLEDGVLKTDKYGYRINRASAKSYASKSNVFCYGSTTGWSDTKNLYMFIDGEKNSFISEFHFKQAINYLSNINQRFIKIACIYEERERKLQEQINNESYEDTNRERIDANKKATAWLDATRIEVTTGICKSSYSDEYKAYGENDFRKRMKGFDYIHNNNFGELLFHGEVVSKEDAEMISKMTEDLSIKIGFMIDKYVAEMELLKLKYKEISESKKNN